MSPRSGYAATMREGDVVYVPESGYESEWWFNWPGLVKKLSNDFCLVEFMGFDKPERRHVNVPTRLLRHLDDNNIRARLVKIANQLRGTEPLKSGTYSRSLVKKDLMVGSDDDEAEDGFM